MKALAIGLSLIFSTAATAGNYATCVIDNVPGVQNDAAAYAASQACVKKYPGGLQFVRQGAGRGWFSYDSGAECIADKAAKTPNQRAGYIIAAACRKLYDEAWWLDSPLAPVATTPPNPPPTAKPTPQHPSPAPSAEEIRFNATVQEIKRKYVFLDESSQYGDAAAIAKVIADRDKFIAAGMAPTDALLRAVDQMVSPTVKTVQKVAVEPVQSRPGKLPQEAPCVIKRVMTDEEIRRCRNAP